MSGVLRAATGQYEHPSASKGTMYPQSARTDDSPHIQGSNIADESNTEPARPKPLPDLPASATGSTHRCYRKPRLYTWMTTIVDLDTGQVLGVVDGRDHAGVGAWLIQRPLEWRLGVHVVAIDPSAAFRKALRMWLPRTAVSVDHFHLVSLANQAVTEVRQPVWGPAGKRLRRRPRLRAANADGSCRWAVPADRHRPESNRTYRRPMLVSTRGDTGPRGQYQWPPAAIIGGPQTVEYSTRFHHEPPRAATDDLERLGKESNQPETTWLWRPICRWWKEIGVLILTGATTGKVETNNTSIKHIKRTGRGFVNSSNYATRIMLRRTARTAVNHP
ncbi:ISL3 family transposase [Arthrobacter sp. Sr24]